MSENSKKIEARLKVAEPRMKKLYAFCKSNYPEYDWTYAFEEEYDTITIDAHLAPDAPDEEWDKWHEITPEIVDKIYELDILSCGILNGSEITCELDAFWDEVLDDVKEGKDRRRDVHKITEAILEGKDIRKSLTSY